MCTVGSIKWIPENKCVDSLFHISLHVQYTVLPLIYTDHMAQCEKIKKQVQSLKFPHFKRSMRVNVFQAFITNWMTKNQDSYKKCLVLQWSVSFEVVRRQLQLTQEIQTKHGSNQKLISPFWKISSRLFSTKEFMSSTNSKNYLTESAPFRQPTSSCEF